MTRHIIPFPTREFQRFFGDDFFGFPRNFRIVKELCHFQERFGGSFSANVVDLQPGNSVFFFHHPVRVVDGTVAEQDAELCFVCLCKFME